VIKIIDHAPRVFLVGVSTPQPDAIQQYLRYRGETWNVFTDGNIASWPETLIEIAGRVCYQSWNNPKKATTGEYIQESIVSHKHGSVLEHVWVNLLVADVCRSVEMEMIRHGDGTAFSWESQRFTDKHLRFIVPPLYRQDRKLRIVFENICGDVSMVYQDIAQFEEGFAVLEGESKLMKRKRSKEAARSILGNCVGADGLFSANLRAARHIIQLRTDESADQSIRETFYEIYRVLADSFPATFEDAREMEGFLGVPQVKFAVEKV